VESDNFRRWRSQARSTCSLLDSVVRFSVIDENPFAVAESCTGAQAAASPVELDRFRVDGDRLVCGRSVRLPMICVYTGAMEDLIAVSQNSQYPSMKLVLRQRTCRLTYFVDRTENRRRDLTRIVCVIAGLLGGVFAGIGMTMTAGWLFLAGIFIIALTSIVFSRLRPPLRLVKFRAPDMFWIRGFPLSYLQRLADHQRGQDNLQG